ncbi:TPA: ethanolamine ammonia-lyase reactivating factor EutA [Escherichia coli]|nr:ethanolamine ammonia-lyase reactivating factor EutA [Escherichia coli]
MKDFITEAWLRANHTLSEGAEIHLPADSRLTPSARELLESRHLRIKFIDEQGRLFVDDEQQQPQPVHGLTSSDEHPQALMQTGLLPAGVTPEIITLSGGVGECYRHQPADPFCFADIGPLLATALHDHPRLREMNVQFPAQTVRATVIGAGAHTLSLSGSTIWLEGVQLPLRNLPVAIPIDETDLVSAWQQALLQLDLDPKTDAYVLALPASLPVRYAAVLTVINALVDFVARFPNPHPLLVVAGQDFGKALGMLLRPQLQQLPLAVIDEVIVRAGDYIDIGTPLFGGSVVPVTVKSLAFPS